MSNYFGNIYRNKKVLVTGNTGFKGSWLSVWLLELGAKVYGLANMVPTEPSMFHELHLEEKVKYHEIDVRDYDKVKAVIDNIQPDFIFHLAAQAIVSESYTNPLHTFSTNVMGTAHVLEAVRTATFPCNLVMITSDKCYNNVEWEWGYKETDAIGGKDVYSGSKAGAETVFYSYYQSFFKNSDRVRVVSVRAGNVIGGGDWAKDRLIPDCVKAWNTGNHVEIRSPKSTRPWQHVLEPLSGYLTIGWQLAERQELSGESFNFGPQSQLNKTVLELIQELACYFNKNANEAYQITDNLPFDEAKLLKLNCDKALFHLKWEAVLSYQELIAFTGEWYAQFYGDNKNMYTFTVQQIEKYQELAQEKLLAWSL